MTDTYTCNRIVVVHGEEDAFLSESLCLAGLRIVYANDQVTVWAPDEWNLGWTIAEPCSWPSLDLEQPEWPEFDAWWNSEEAS